MSSLVLYYSYSGNTRKIGEIIQRLTDAAIAEIETVQPYPTDYDACVAQAEKEVKLPWHARLVVHVCASSPHRAERLQMGGQNRLSVRNPWRRHRQHVQGFPDILQRGRCEKWAGRLFQRHIATQDRKGHQDLVGSMKLNCQMKKLRELPDLTAEGASQR